MKKTSQVFYWLVALSQLIAVGALDFASGYELRLGALYAVPVGFAAWFLGVTPGIIIAITAATLELLVERASGRIYSVTWFGYANALSRLIIFVFVAFSISYFRKTLNLAQSRLRAFQGRLPVCACCHRIDGGDGFWLDFPTYLQKNSPVVPEFRTCPLCVREGTKPRIGGS